MSTSTSTTGTKPSAAAVDTLGYLFPEIKVAKSFADVTCNRLGLVLLILVTLLLFMIIPILVNVAFGYSGLYIPFGILMVIALAILLFTRRITCSIKSKVL